MRIVISKPDPVMAKLMRFVLTESGHEAVITRTAAEALEAVLGRETGAVLLDVDLPDLSGLELCKELRARQFVGPVLFVTSHRDTRDKTQAFNYGADDYIVEPFDPQELVLRVDVVARRCMATDRQPMATIVKAGNAELMINDLAFQVEGRCKVLLTPTEMRLLECLMRNAGITISRDSLIERTWGYDFVGDSNRVEVYVARLRKKIERNPSQPEYLHTIRGIGYVFRVEHKTSTEWRAPRVSEKKATTTAENTWPVVIANGTCELRNDQ
jgi:two-component system response regulator RegX3